MSNPTGNNGQKPGVRKGGRKKGTVNKKTVWLREELDKANIDFGKYLRQAFEEKDIRMLNALAGFLPYLNPKIKDKELPEEKPEESDLKDEDTAKLLSLASKSSVK